MQKAALINLFGSVRKTAKALGMSTSGFGKWPGGELESQYADRALGACIRIKGLAITKAYFPAAFEATDNG